MGPSRAFAGAIHPSERQGDDGIAIVDAESNPSCADVAQCGQPTNGVVERELFDGATPAELMKIGLGKVDPGQEFPDEQVHSREARHVRAWSPLLSNEAQPRGSDAFQTGHCS